MIDMCICLLSRKLQRSHPPPFYCCWSISSAFHRRFLDLILVHWLCDASTILGGFFVLRMCACGRPVDMWSFLLLVVVQRLFVRYFLWSLWHVISIEDWIEVSVEDWHLTVRPRCRSFTGWVVYVCVPEQKLSHNTVVHITHHIALMMVCWPCCDQVYALHIDVHDLFARRSERQQMRAY